MRGIKLYGGQHAKAGQHPSAARSARGGGDRVRRNVGIGRDWTLFALAEGVVQFDQGGRRINVVPLEA